MGPVGDGRKVKSGESHWDLHQMLLMTPGRNEHATSRRPAGWSICKVLLAGFGCQAQGMGLDLLVDGNPGKANLRRE